MDADHPVLGTVGALYLLIVGPPRQVKLVREYWAPKVAVWPLRAGGEVEKSAARLSGRGAAGTQAVGTGTAVAEEVWRLRERG
ncbi:hypothetical protein ACFXD5_23680 [Streptomyces sp. NPDC059385]|uniref:hypothetical protein n=1 Tax=Streptomyces sp. NPDC059385 TaxID=3346817 RepID=UPI0036830B3E